MRDLLVTGTDTGVGKTIVAAALITALRARGVRTVGFKPAETGVNSDERTDSDVLALASGEQNPLARPLLSLAEPLAPAVASERAGVTLNPDDIEARIASLREEGYAVVVEGAGGVMVPLSWGYTVLHLAKACDLDAVVVARAGLGTLNHTVMTVMMLRSYQVPVRGVILNGRSATPDAAELTNASSLSRMLHGVRVLEIPHEPSASRIEAAASVVDRLL